VTYNYADEYCKKRGTKLAELETEDEYNHVRNKLDYDVWLGAKKINGKWIWQESNLTLDYGSVQGNEGDCLRGARVTLRPALCDSGNMIFMCEYEGIKPYIQTTTTSKPVAVHETRSVKVYNSFVAQRSRIQDRLSTINIHKGSH
jgi:hypothetical protein